MSLFTLLSTLFCKSSSRTFSYSILSIKSSFLLIIVSAFFNGSILSFLIGVVYDVISYVGVFSIGLNTLSTFVLLSFCYYFFGPLLDVGSFLF